MKKVLSIMAVVLVVCALTLGLVGCVSPSAFKVKITSPKNGTTVNESTVTVTGSVAGYTRGEVVSDGQSMRLAPEVTVNGVKAEVAEDGTFSSQVTLVEGHNTIKAVAMFNNLTVKDTVQVKYEPLAAPLSIEITSPEDDAELTESPATITGKVSNAEATVKVNDAGVVVDEDGSFSAQVELTEGENIITAAAVLKTQEAEDSVTVTYTLPASPLSVEITSPEDGADVATDSVTITGTVSDAEATVKVNDIDATVAEDGTFTAQVTLIEGENTIEAVATSGEEEATDSIKVTYTAPLPELTVKIASPEDGATLTVGMATVTGSVSEAAAVVKVNGADVVVAEDGTFSANVTLTEGSNTITASAVLGERTAEDSITVTYTIPTPVLTVDITSPEDGTVSATNAITVTGTVSDADATVKVNTIDAVVADDGTFAAQVTLTEGENTIEAVATSGTLEAKDSIKVTYTAPLPALALEITSPVDGANLSESIVNVTGTISEAAAVVKVNGTDVVVAEDGTFSTDVTLTEGSNTITASAVLGERTAEDSVTVTYTIPAPVLTVDITSPEDGTVSTTNSVTVTGTVSIVEATVKVNGVDVAVAEDGTFSASVALVKGENTIEAVATSGELTATDSIKVSYTGPSLSLEVNTNPLNVTGKVSDPQAVVTVNGSQAEVAEDGTFSAQVTLIEGENVITVVATLDGDETSYSFKVTYTPENNA